MPAERIPTHQVIDDGDPETAARRAKRATRCQALMQRKTFEATPPRTGPQASRDPKFIKSDFTPTLPASPAQPSTMPDSTPVLGDHSRATPDVQKYRPRACQSCARSKMRCVWPSEPGATPCQRCAKIKAPCTLPEINPRRRRGPSTRVGQLEEKIDGIMSLLNASQQIQQNSPSSRGHSPPGSAPPAPTLEQSRHGIHQLLNPNTDTNNSTADARGVDGPDREPLSTPSSSANFHTNASFIPPAGLVAPVSIAAGVGPSPDTSSANPFLDRDLRPTATNEYVEIVKGFRMTFLEAERSLNLYRSVYSPYFPFVPVPVMMSSRELYEKSPFLFRSVVAVTTPQSPDIQAEYRVWFREYVAQHVVVNNERRLEVLQAILIHLAWGDYYFMIDSQATNLIQLAVALVIDLGLNRYPLDFGKANFMMLREAVVASGEKNPWRNKTHTLSEMRAALGTFYVCSLCSSLFRRHHPMMYNSYLQKCCDTLGEAQDYDSDKFLVALVRIQQLLNRAADIIPYSDDESSSRIPYPPHHMALTAVQRELEALIREQPPDVECNALLWTHYHGTLCRLFEPVIYIRSASVVGCGYDPGEGTARTAALWQCLSSARDFFSAHLAIPAQALPSLPFHSAHVSFCLITTARLLFLGDEGVVGGGGGGGGAPGGDPDWNPALAREAVDFGAICEKVSGFCDEADRIATATGRRARYVHPDRSVLGMYRDKTRWIREWYTTRIRTGGGPAAAAAAGGGLAASSYGGIPAENRHDRGGGGMPKDSGPDAVGSSGTSSSAGGSSMPTTTQGAQAMDVDHGVQAQAAMPGDLDFTFWQAMFDWNWSGPVDLMEVQG